MFITDIPNSCQSIELYSAIAVGILFVVSEYLGASKACKSNGILHAFINCARKTYSSTKPTRSHSVSEALDQL